MPEANISGLGNPAPDEPFSSSSSGTSPILGTNQLQGIVDHFGQIVDKLGALYDKACGSADASGLPGIKGSPASSNAGGPSFPQVSASGAGIYSAVQAQPGQVDSRAPGLNMWSAGGNGQGFMGQASFGGQPGAPGVTVPAPGNGGIPGGQAVGAFAGNAFAAAGTSKLGTQVAFSNYLQQAYTFSGGQPGGTGLNNRMLAQAIGRPGAWNTIATGPGDALSGTAVMQQAAGRWNLTGPGSTSLSRTMQGDAMGMGYATGSSMTEAGSLSTFLNSPMTSYRMMMMGFPVQPRQPYGQGPNQGYGNVLAGINKYSFGKDTVDPRKAQSFYSTYGAGYQELLQLTGGDQAMASQLAKTSVDMNNAVFNSKKNTGTQLDWNQVQGLLGKAATGDKGARSTLDKLGISETEQQRLKDTTAGKTGGSAELFNSFQSGLTTSTAALNAFTNVINSIIKLPGVNQLVGGVGGISAVGGPAGALLNTAKDFATGNLTGAISSGLSMIPGISSVIGVPGGGSSGSGNKSLSSSAGSIPQAPKNTGSGITAQAKTAVADAQSQLGLPYLWGAEDPGKAFDCCLVPWSMVQTVSGPVPIKDIKAGDLVFAWENGYPVLRPVTARSEPRYQMTYRIKTNRRSLEASGNHPFHVVLTGRNQRARLEWMRLDDLRPGDRIVTMDSLPDTGEIPGGLHASRDYLWLLGAMFGDGHLSKSRKQVYLCMFGKQREHAREVLQNITGNKIVDHPIHGIYVADAALHRQLSDDGMDKKSTERMIPGWIWGLPHKLMEEFLEGYTAADGSLASTKSYLAFEYKAANETLIRQVRNIHMVIGNNVSQVSKSERTKPIIIKGKTVDKARPLYCFEAYPESERKANDYLSRHPNVRKLFPSDCFMPERVLSIEPLCEQDTYDIEVDGTHNFIAEGINVHNSGLTQWSYKQAGVDIPRTAAAQWDYLSGRRRAIALDKVQEGDLIFKAGSGGSAGSPGHVAMMISNNAFVEAEMTGVPIHDRPYRPGDWQHAGRPTGSTAGSAQGGVSSSGPGSSGSGTGTPASSTAGGPNISGLSAGGSPSSTSEADNVAAGLAGGVSGGTGTGPSSPGTSSGTSAPASTAPSGTGKGNPNVSTAGGGSAAANRALGQKIAAQMFGWKGAQWNALDKLWGTYESGWDNNAQNPSSTAYGIAQFLDSTWAPYGPKTSNPGLQEKYGMEYIRDRYKDPVHALAFELSNTPHWYSAGTNSAKAGAAVLGERGPEIALLSGGQKIFDAKQTQEMLQSAKRPAQMPWKSAPGQGPGDSFGHSVQLTFAPGSIVIGGGDAGGTRWDTSNSAREFVRKVKKVLEAEDLYGAIASGQKES